MTQTIARSALLLEVAEYLKTQTDASHTKEEYYATPHDLAKSVLTDFIKFAAPDPLDTQIKNLEAKLESLKAERANQ